MSGHEREPDDHVITILIKKDGTVQGDLDDTTALWPIGTESTAESTPSTARLEVS
jgi:hypothetical protein